MCHLPRTEQFCGLILRLENISDSSSNVKPVKFFVVVSKFYFNEFSISSKLFFKNSVKYFNEMLEEYLLVILNLFWRFFKYLTKVKSILAFTVKVFCFVCEEIRNTYFPKYSLKYGFQFQIILSDKKGKHTLIFKIF